MANVVTYNSYITAAGNAGKFEEARAAFTEAINNNMPDVVIYNNFIDLLIRQDDWSTTAIGWFIKAFPKPIYKDNCLDLHGMSFGSAFIACHEIVLNKLKNSVKEAKISFMVGRGLHSRGEHIVRRAVELFVSLHSNISMREDMDEGILTLTINGSYNEAQTLNVRFVYNQHPSHNNSHWNLNTLQSTSSSFSNSSSSSDSSSSISSFLSSSSSSWNAATSTESSSAYDCSSSGTDTEQSLSSSSSFASGSNDDDLSDEEFEGKYKDVPESKRPVRKSSHLDNTSSSSSSSTNIINRAMPSSFSSSGTFRSLSSSSRPSSSVNNANRPMSSSSSSSGMFGPSSSSSSLSSLANTTNVPMSSFSSTRNTSESISNTVSSRSKTISYASVLKGTSKNIRR